MPFLGLRPTPENLRLYLVRLGPTFVKLGQFLAMRPDILPEEYCLELMHLLDEVPPFPWEEARRILTAELGQDPEYLFAEIDPVPFAAASLSQVHAARLKDGSKVAIKVQRPDLRRRVLRDLRKARLLARVMELSGATFVASPRKVVEELSGWMMQEIDFSCELANLTRMYGLMAGSKEERVPRPYPQFSTTRVLTSELLHGTPVSWILLLLRSRRDDAVEQIKAKGIDTSRFAESLMRSVLKQIFRLQFFHADLHPGNLLVLPGNVIGFVDFGLCDELDERVREQQFRYLSAVYTNDLEQMYQALCEILLPGESTDLDAFHADFLAQSHHWLSALKPQKRKGKAPAAGPSPIATGMIQALRLARKHHLQLPTRILSMYRSLLGAETIADQLGTSADLRSEGRAFFRQMGFEEFFKAFQPAALVSQALAAASLARNSPAQINRILSDLAENRFSFRVVQAESPKLTRLRNRRTRLTVTAILSVSVTLLLTIPGLPPAFGVPLRPVLVVALLVIYAGLIYQWTTLK